MRKLQVQEVTAVPTSDLRGQLGEVVETVDGTNGRRLWKYVQFDNGTGNVASAAGSVACYVPGSYTSSKVTCDVSDSDTNHVAGIFTQSFTDQYYGWLLVEGYYGAVLTDGGDDIAAGDCLIADPSTDGVCDSVAQDTAPTNKVLGWALAADVDANNTVAARITVGGA